MLENFGNNFDELHREETGVFNQTLEEEQKFIHKLSKDFLEKVKTFNTFHFLYN